ncbi:GspE/PulE family protein [Neorhodopirellula pilleata]|uniref:Type II secretion system protein E n=1 Tax=Neorhodopirellula pilleata TaxID=2714738 RepID=A0A5C6A2T2_9BACT|nr:GspE/PulE family protein [Neorhodopirellula pilleata]TWT94212.1 Type II secretion system protein E [Neorhodopirellula pilleata]
MVSINSRLETENQELIRQAEFFGMQAWELQDVVVDAELVATFPSQLLFRENMLPIEVNGGKCFVAVSDPKRLEGIEQLAAQCRWPIVTVLSEPDPIRRHLHRLLGVGGSTVRDLVARSNDEVDELCEAAGDEIDDKSQASSVVKLVNELIVEAVSQRASDVHIEPEKDELIVRFRVDGVLQQQHVPVEIQRFRSAIVSRIKIMAKLNIAERRLPQDGRIHLNLKDGEIDLRVSVIPTHHGESIVLRLLSGGESDLGIDQLRLPEDIRIVWEKLIRRSNGLLLVTGPTGSGKTTTLYSSLAAIRCVNTKITTIEDPIEYKLRQVSQIQVEPEIGLTFARGLRSLLRHDPDVVLVGEIRDTETAKISVQASMTGHLVFSTLHTNDAASAYTRLVDMGVEPYMVASTVEAVLAQRLVRRLCVACRKPEALGRAEVPNGLYLRDDATIYQAVGCRHCHGTGYSGRQAIFELLQTDSNIRKLCQENVSADEIRQAAVAAGTQTLRASAWELVQQGQTTVAEMFRVSPA